MNDEKTTNFEQTQTIKKKKPVKLILIIGMAIIVLAGLGYTGYSIYIKKQTKTNTLENPAGNNTITIKDGKFDPKYYSVKEGTRVTWINEDVKDHQLKFDGFESGKMAPKDIFSHMFDKKGTYNYHCALHPKETGKITVD